MFRGREQSRPELGYRLLQRLGADVADYGFVETSAKQDGRNMTMVLAPHRGAKTRAACGPSKPVAARASSHPAATPTMPNYHRQHEDLEHMPKAKTHSGASKRFRRTGTGKIVRQKASRRHLLEHKPTKRTRGWKDAPRCRPTTPSGSTSCSTADRQHRPWTNHLPNEIGTLPWHA